MSLTFDEVGQGKVVVLLHAFPLSRAMWRPQREALAGHCRLLTPDLPGFGGSPMLVGPPTVESMADAVAGFLDERGLTEPVTLGGLSMGGYIAFAFARKYPQRLAGLILADTKAEADDDEAKAGREKMIGFAATNHSSAVIEQLLPKLLGSAAQANTAIVDEVKRIASSQRPAAIIAALQSMRSRPDSTPTMAEIKVPTLILVGSDDALTPPAAAERMAQGIAGSKMVTIEGAGHLANLENPQAFSDALKAFLA